MVMDGCRSIVVAALCAALAAGIAQPAAAQPSAGNPATRPAGQGPAPAGQLILDDASLWRAYHTWQTPLVRKAPGAELTEVANSSSYGPIFAARTPPPPAEWMQPEFDDGTWAFPPRGE